MSGEPYVVYGTGFSLFTRKLDAALRFYGAPFRLEAKALRAGARAVALPARAPAARRPAT